MSLGDSLFSEASGSLIENVPSGMRTNVIPNVFLSALRDGSSAFADVMLTSAMRPAVSGAVIAWADQFVNMAWLRLRGWYAMVIMHLRLDGARVHPHER